MTLNIDVTLPAVLHLNAEALAYYNSTRELFAEALASGNRPVMFGLRKLSCGPTIASGRLDPDWSAHDLAMLAVAIRSEFGLLLGLIDPITGSIRIRT